jgi:hypothetical protein
MQEASVKWVGPVADTEFDGGEGEADDPARCRLEPTAAV